MKLIRGKIPDLMKKDGQKPRVEMASKQVYRRLLEAKLLEEFSEYLQSKKPEELADVLEVIYSIGVADGIEVDALNALRRDKLELKGGYTDQLVLFD